MRLFFGIALDERVRASATRLVTDVQQRLARGGRPRAVKWGERENLHVTLRFLGEHGEDQARAVIEASREPLPTPRFDLVLGGAGAFPASGAPRVLWIGAVAGAGAAREVFDQIERRLAPLGLEREPRPYTPHLTLGRVREIDRAGGRDLREWLAAAPSELGTERVDRVTLYRSHLSPQGPRYEMVAEVPLS